MLQNLIQRRVCARNLAALGLIISSAGTSGCLVAAAGIVEVSRGPVRADPMGQEYQGPHEWLGWYQDYDDPAAAMGNLYWGLQGLRCHLTHDPQELTARCYNTPQLVALQQGALVYRLCAPGTDRMQCRMAWEKVHKAAPQPFLGREIDG